MRGKGLRINLRPLAEIQTLAWLLLAGVMLNYLLRWLGTLALMLLQAVFARPSSADTALMPIDSSQQELAHIEQQLGQFHIR